MTLSATLNKLKKKSWLFAFFLLPLMLAAAAPATTYIPRESIAHSLLRGGTPSLSLQHSSRTSKGEVLLADNCRTIAGDPRGPVDSLIPYVISPRRTLLLSDKPKLRWNVVPGVKRYTASLMKGEKMVWETTSSANEVVYPGEPKLEPGVDYLLVVKADNGKSSQQEKSPARGFRLLPAAEAQVVRAAIEQLNNQQVADKAKALVRTYLYIGSDLKSEAIETLEALVAGGIREAMVYRRLGDLYWQAAVNVLAESSYLEAAKLATAAKDIQEQAQVQAALGELYVAIADKQQAIRWLTQARDSHKTLGNTQRVQELETQIKALNS